jgi:hypothetical protein
MDLFRPDLARTLLRGVSCVPAAKLDMLPTCSPSTHTIAWFLLISVLSLCKKSLRTILQLAMVDWLWLARWLFTFSNFVVVLEPNEFKQILKLESEKLSEHYFYLASLSHTCSHRLTLHKSNATEAQEACNA